MSEYFYYPPLRNVFAEVDDILIAFTQHYGIKLQYDYKDFPVRVLIMPNGKSVQVIEPTGDGTVKLFLESEESIKTTRMNLFTDLQKLL